MTAPFLESPRFPDDLAIWARGGVGFNTTVNGSTSGREQRNSLWQFGRGSWDLQNAFRSNTNVNDQYSVQTLRNFFRLCKGQAYGFRFRDWTDYLDEGNGVMGQLSTYGQAVVPSGAGTGLATVQLYKRYVSTPLADYRLIAKPLSVSLFRNLSAPPGSGAGSASLDTTTGLVTWTADSTAAVTGWTPGATTVLNVASVPGTWVAGKVLSFTGVTGTGAALLNNQACTIASVASGTVTLSVSTTGLTLAGGTAQFFPQASDALTWTGTFDTPCRFGTDQFAPQLDPGSGALFGFQTLTVVEIRP